MALNLNAPNLSGLATLAGQNSQLNLQNPGALGLQAVQMAIARKQAKENEATQRMAIRQQGELGLLNFNLNERQLAAQQQMAQDAQRSGAADRGLEAQKIGMMQQAAAQKAGLEQYNADRDFNLDTQKTALGAQEKQQELMFKYQEAEMKKFMEDKKETLKEKGAFYSYARMGMNSLKTPEEKQQLRLEILKEAQEKGYATKEEAAAAAKMPLSVFDNALDSKIILAGMAKEYKDMNPDEKGGSKITLADGTVIEQTSPLTAGSTTDAQKDQKEIDANLRELAVLRRDFEKNQDMFTYAGQGKTWLAEKAEKAKGLPVLEDLTNAAAKFTTGMTKEERSKMIEDRSKYANAVAQFFQKYQHKISGAAVSEPEVVRLQKSYINGDMSASEYKGAMDQIWNKVLGEDSYNKAFLSEGVNLSPAVAQKRQQLMERTGKSQEEVDAFLKSKGEM